MADNYDQHQFNAGGAGGRYLTKRAIEVSAGIYADAVVPMDGSGNPVAGGNSGLTASASFTPSAAAYGAGDVMGTTPAVELSFVDRNGVAVPAGSTIRILTATTKIDITAVPSGQTSYTLHLYSVTPPSAQADNDAWTLASGDLPSYLGSIALGTPVDLGAALYVRAGDLNMDIKLDAGKTSVFGVLVTVGAHTAAATARQIALRAVVL